MSLWLCRIIERHIRSNVNSRSPKATLLLTMQHRLFVQILAALNGDHNTTIYDLVVQTLRSQETTYRPPQSAMIYMIVCQSSPQPLSGPLHCCQALCVASVLTGWAFQYKCKGDFRRKWQYWWLLERHQAALSFWETKQDQAATASFGSRSPTSKLFSQ
jgi:hypothetical protein